MKRSVFGVMTIVVAAAFMMLSGCVSTEEPAPADVVGYSEAGTPDPRLSRAFDSIGIKYTTNSSGNYIVSYQMENNPDRSHGVFVVSETQVYRGIEMREMWSVAAVLPSYPNEDIIRAMMSQNSTIKLGAWAIEASDEEVWIIYTIKVPADQPAKDIANMIYFVAEICDEWEEEYIGDDIY